MSRPGVLAALEKWSVGRLTVHFPDGTSRTFGTPGAEPHAAIRIHRDAFFRRFVLQGDLGAGESYMDGDWSSDDLPLFVKLVLLNRRHLPLDTPVTKLLNLGNDLWHRLRANTRRGSRRNIRYHYDLSNDFFSLFLDETMTYSSALFAHAGQSLAEAQRNKFRRLAEKALIGPQDHVLEIGCGWGGFAIFAARTYGCRVTGITISEQQHRLARQRVAAAGLEDRVEIRLQDYRDLAGRFDKIVSIEMFEALGQENWATVLPEVRGRPRTRTAWWPSRRSRSRITASTSTRSTATGSRSGSSPAASWLRPWASAAPWRGRAPSASTISRTSASTTRSPCGAGARRSSRTSERVRALGFDERFIRMWDYYLSTCEAAFETRTLGNLQLVLSRDLNRALPGIPAAAVRAA